jgi:general secretion pathway protein G
MERESGTARGFTLLELLVVLMVMGLVMTVAVPQVMNVFSGAKHDAAALHVESLTTALQYYQMDTGSYPTAEQGLHALLAPPPGVQRWRGPYVRRKLSLVDPWGRPYRYAWPGRHGAVDVFSYGADGAEGGQGEGADVGNWDP